MMMLIMMMMVGEAAATGGGGCSQVQSHTVLATAAAAAPVRRVVCYSSLTVAYRPLTTIDSSMWRILVHNDNDNDKRLGLTAKADQPDHKKYNTPKITRSSADTDKPARRVYSGYGFLLVFYRNFVPNTHRFLRYILALSNTVTLKSGSKVTIR